MKVDTVLTNMQRLLDDIGNLPYDAEIFGVYPTPGLYGSLPAIGLSEDSFRTMFAGMHITRHRLPDGDKLIMQTETCVFFAYMGPTRREPDVLHEVLPSA